jgi:lipopolysaccharide transport system ATP-binding protein
MNNDILIEAKNVSKKFAKNFKLSLYYGITDVFKTVGKAKQGNALRKSEFWALKDVSFTVKRGECLGLIGHNGAGKSTLLKMLNGLINPDEGSIIMRGKIGALIELGAGFNSILTGRENIYNNAAIIGFSRKEIDEKFDSIIAFSEIGEFIDMPVQNYSSGMKVRLGFAIAAQMEPDVLLIDEVLAVGDLGFRMKCMNRIQELLKNSAVIFVSHAMTQISVICNNLILMDHGKIEFNGTDIGDGIEKYISKFSSNEQQILTAKGIILKESSVSAEGQSYENGILALESGSKLKVRFTFSITDVNVKKLIIRVAVVNMEYRIVAEVDSFHSTNNIIENTNGKVVCEVEIEGLYLRFGKYSLHVTVRNITDTEEIILRQNDFAHFMVQHTFSVGPDFLLPSTWKEIV